MDQPMERGVQITIFGSESRPGNEMDGKRASERGTNNNVVENRHLLDSTNHRYKIRGSKIIGGFLNGRYRWDQLCTGAGKKPGPASDEACRLCGNEGVAASTRPELVFLRDPTVSDVSRKSRF